MEEFLKIDRPKEEIELMSPLTWAYIGDAVYELFIRNKLINETNLKPHKLHIDAINYVKAKRNDVVVDLCSGTGIIAILLTAKTSAKKIIGVEIQKSLYDIACDNIALNNLQDKLQFINIPLQDAYKVLGKESVNVVVCNPPYTKTPHILNVSEEIASARHEIRMNLEELIISASRLLKYGGKFYFVHRVERLQEIMNLLQKNQMQAKEITPIYPNNKKEGYLVMIMAVKKGNPGLKLKSPIFN